MTDSVSKKAAAPSSTASDNQSVNKSPTTPTTPTDPAAPADPEQPAAPAPIKITPDELLDHLDKLPDTTPEQPATIELTMPEGEEPFVMPDLSKLAEEEIYFELVIPEGITDIGESLQGLETLTSVTIPDTVTTLAANTFAGCTGLTSVTVPGNMSKEASKDIFKDCTGLEEVTLTGTEVDSSWRDALRKASIKTLVFDGDMPSIGDNSNPPFTCINVEEIIIKKGGQSIGRSAFYNCANLKKVTISGSVTKLDKQVFEDCYNLQEVIIENGVKEIGSSAFANCYSLTKITIPESVTTLDSFCFSKCKSLTEITIPDSVTSIPQEAFRYCINLEKVTIGKGVKTICQSAFNDCVKLTEITIPANVTTLNKNALFFSNFTTIHFENTNGWESGNIPTGKKGETSQPWDPILPENLCNIDYLKDLNNKKDIRWNSKIAE